jgi:hypothetical protein
MDQDQQQPVQEVVETQSTHQEKPDLNTHSQPSNDETSARDLYNQAVEDIQGLPILGRIALAFCILIIMCKLTPVLDILWLFLQIVVIPLMLLISIGLMSHDTYMLIVGWLNESVSWSIRKVKSDEEASK